MPGKKIYEQIVNTQEDEDGYFPYPRITLIDLPVQTRGTFTVSLTQPMSEIEREQGPVLFQRDK